MLLGPRSWNRRSYSILARNFSLENEDTHKKRKGGQKKRDAHSGVHSSDERGEGAHRAVPSPRAP